MFKLHMWMAEIRVRQNCWAASISPSKLKLSDSVSGYVDSVEGFLILIVAFLVDTYLNCYLKGD
jgi:hypothetical protein